MLPLQALRLLLLLRQTTEVLFSKKAHWKTHKQKHMLQQQWCMQDNDDDHH